MKADIERLRKKFIEENDLDDKECWAMIRLVPNNQMKKFYETWNPDNSEAHRKPLFWTRAKGYLSKLGVKHEHLPDVH